MSKAIAIIEMPNSCDRCPLFGNHYSDLTCRVNRNSIDYPYPKDFRQDWCPLQELPERKEDSDCFDEFEDGYAQGWNNCLDEILGE